MHSTAPTQNTTSGKIIPLGFGLTLYDASEDEHEDLTFRDIAESLAFHRIAKQEPVLPLTGAPDEMSSRHPYREAAVT